MNGPLGKSSESCLSLAKIAIQKLINQMNPEDKFGLVSFNTSVTNTIQLSDKNRLKILSTEINLIEAAGGTSLSSGIKVSIKMFDKLENNREKRIIFLTDMQNLNDREFENLIKMASINNIFTTIIGIGFKFNSEFTQKIAKYKGTNYFSATEERHLNKIIVEQFNYNFFPFAYDVFIDYCSSIYEVERLYGTPFDTKKKLDQSEWTTFKHKYYSPKIKHDLEFLLMYFKRIKKHLPKPVLANFINFSGGNLVTVCEVNTMTPSFLIKHDNLREMEGGLFLFQLKSKDEKFYSCIHNLIVSGKDHLGF